ncbi:MAG: tripartite tricarboxylate transporter substrate-binding protein [Candidatus Latescibacterota bacterium]
MGGQEVGDSHHQRRGETYKGATPALTGTVSGEVDVNFPNMTTCVSLIKSGKLRALGITSSKRATLLPDLPAISETIPGYEFLLWQGLAAPARTPPAILAKLNNEVIKALKTSAVRERMAAMGNEPLGSSQKDFAVFIGNHLEKMRETVRVSGAKPED